MLSKEDDELDKKSENHCEEYGLAVGIVHDKAKASKTIYYDPQLTLRPVAL